MLKYGASEGCGPLEGGRLTGEEFSIGVLAARTGLTPGVLRTWENRFGFPEGTRTDSGHRRFGDADVALVLKVLDARAGGVPLQLAIDGVREQHQQMHRPSVFGELTRRFPALPPRQFDRRILVAVSHAIEDECLASGEPPLALGAFQQGVRFSEAEPRWHELARTALWSAVVADFDDGTPPNADMRPLRVHLPTAAPMRREWTVVCLSPSFAAVLAAWEVPGRGPGQERYEAVVSTSRAVTQTAARVLCGVVTAAGVEVPDRVEQLLADQQPEAVSSAADADRLFVRALSYLNAPRG